MTRKYLFPIFSALSIQLIDGHGGSYKLFIIETQFIRKYLVLGYVLSKAKQ